VADIDVPQCLVGAPLCQRRPVDNLEVHCKARQLQIFGRDLGHLVVELVLAAGQDADGLSVIACLLGSRGCAFRIRDIVVAFDTCVRAPGEVARIDVAIRRVEVRTAEGGSHHVFHAERLADCLADRNVLCNAGSGVKDEYRIAKRLQEQRLGRR